VDAAKAAGAPLDVLTGTEAECLTNGSGNRFDTIMLRERGSGRRRVYRARRYVIAAGAIGSPSLLLRSGLSGQFVGRHYMYHLSPIVAGLFLTRTGGDASFIKQVGFADFYFGSPDFKHKLGIVQSLPVPGPLLLAKAAKVRLPGVVSQFLRRHLLPLAGIVEDLPNPENRVFLTKNGGLAIRHSFSDYDRDRGQHLTRLMAKILKTSGALTTLTTAFSSDEHVAHQCGTLRFGRSAVHAVADPDCRLFERTNTFVVDGSVFPTSLGVGPALTIIANALRVARAILAEL
jgi:choline dehydrogenase-like flavoprotein